jgi:Domain of unknown function (DUF6647)
METTLTAIVTWLSVNFGMPAIYDLPRIELVSPEVMHAVRYQKRGTDGSAPTALQTSMAVEPDRLLEVEALYDDATRTIYLRREWTGRTPAELSVLVHEMVHHLQNVAGLKYACPAAREKPAYDAQDRWLSLFGRNLVDEFKLDPMTVLVRTHCLF